MDRVSDDSFNLPRHHGVRGVHEQRLITGRSGVQADVCIASYGAVHEDYRVGKLAIVHNLWTEGNI